MMTPDHAGILLWDTQDELTCGPAKMTIHLPTDRVLQDSELIDQVIDAVFDRLGHTAVELRVGLVSRQ